MKKTKTTHTRNKMNPKERNYNALGMSPRPVKEHQRIIKKFINGIDSLKTFDEKRFESLSETELGEPNSIAPDVVVFNLRSEKPHFLIEIERTQGIKKTIVKTQKALKDFPTIKEAFIYDYEKKIFYKVEKTSYKKSAQSDFLKTDLKKMI